jgi:hypothetical protein
MMIETAVPGNNSSFWAVSSDSPPVLNTPLDLKDGTGLAPWATNDNRYSFPHCLPMDPAQYQAQATGVWMYADAHVAVVTPNTPGVINSSHFVLNGKKP